VFLLAVSAAGPSAASSATPRPRVLAVDDEPGILGSLRRVLGRDGCDVVGVADPREALGLLRQGEPFDVVLCDLMMPHLRGDALYEEVRQVNPAMAARFVFLSGGATQPDVVAFLAGVPNEQLDKPFDIQALRGLVRRFAARPRATASI